ncbi:MAG: hypothetical protein ABSH05_23200 [Bryobacteraceae bacterium]|jgi:hypothetical protein
MNWKAFFKSLGMAAAAGAATAGVSQIQTAVPASIASPIVAAITAVIAYFMKPPHK